MMPNFPKYTGPVCLNPFNPYHYVLLTYWVFLRPRELHGYLYQASPRVYRFGGVARFWQGWRVPAYRRVYAMLPGAVVAAVVFLGLALWFYRLGMTVGHTSWVNAVAVSGDGAIAVTAAGDRFERVQLVAADATLKVWDLRRGEERSTLRGHQMSVETVAVSSDGRTAVSGGRDRTVRVWNLDNGKLVRTLTAHRDWITKVAILPEQEQFLSASMDKTFKLWALDGEQPLFNFTGHRGGIRDLAVAAGRLVSASQDQTLKVWDLQQRQEIYTLEGHREPVNRVAVTGDGRWAVSAGDRRLRIWDLTTGRSVAELGGHTGTITDVVISPDNQLAISASTDKTVRVWQIPTGQLRHTLAGHTGWVTDLAVTGGGQLVSGSSDRTVRVWDLTSGKPLKTLTGHQNWVRTVSTTPDGQTIISTSFERLPRLWAAGRAVGWAGLERRQILLGLVYASFGSLGALCALAAMAVVLAISVVATRIIGPLLAVLGINAANSIILAGALILLDRFRNNPSFQEQVNGELVVLGLYLIFGLLLGLTFSAAFGLLNRRAAAAFAGMGFILLIGFASGIVTVVLFTAAISIRGRVLPAVGTFRTIAFGFNLMVAVGALRLPVYICQLPWSFLAKGDEHPILWDEMTVLPLWGSGQFVEQHLSRPEPWEKILPILANPWQAYVVQRALSRHLHKHPQLILEFYSYLSDPQLYSYITPPVSSGDWQSLPTAKQVLLGTIAGIWVDTSTDALNRLCSRVIWLITYPWRRGYTSPIKKWAGLIYQVYNLPNQPEAIGKLRDLLAAYQTTLQKLSEYPAGAEVSQFWLLAQQFLDYQSWEEIHQNPGELVEASFPEFEGVATAMGELLEIGKTELNHTSMGKIFYRLSNLSVESPLPEARLVGMISRHWQSLLLEYPLWSK